MRRAVLLAPLALLAGCSGTPTADEVADRWPESVDELVTPPSAVQDHYEEIYLDVFEGAASVDIFRLDETSTGWFGVFVITGEDELSSDEVSQYRCDLLSSVGALKGPDGRPLDGTTDEYDGDGGLQRHRRDLQPERRRRRRRGALRHDRGPSPRGLRRAGRGGRRGRPVRPS